MSYRARRNMSHRALALVVILVFAGLAIAEEGTAPVASARSIASAVISWQITADHDGVDLTVRSPNGQVEGRSFMPGDLLVFDLTEPFGDPLPDGLYTWEVRLRPVLSAQARHELESANDGHARDQVRRRLIEHGELPAEPMVFSSVFRVRDGSIWDPQRDRTASVEHADDERSPQASTESSVILGDLSVRSNLCVGSECSDSEVFGDDTLRLKAEALRLHLEDTSVDAGFPTNDWRIVANDAIDGGADYLAIEDASGGRTPFELEAGARNHALYISSDSHIGLRTTNPSTEIHAVAGDTPTLRLEQDGSSGFAPQTWDVAGNETSFFIRDVTAGSTSPLRIRPGAPSNRLTINTDGEVGIGLLDAAATLHIRGSDGATRLLVEEDSTTVESRTLLELENNGGVFLDLDDTDTATTWRLGNSLSTLTWIGPNNNGFLFADSGVFQLLPNGVQQFTFLANGDLLIAGTLTQNVKAAERNLSSESGLEPHAVLRDLPKLGVQSWSSDSGRHIGPAGSELAALFGIGDRRSIAPMDVAAVAVLAAQALQEQAAAQQLEIESLRAQLAAETSARQELLHRLEALEALTAHRTP